MYRLLDARGRHARLSAIVCALALAGCSESSGRKGTNDDSSAPTIEAGWTNHADGGIHGGESTSPSGDSGGGDLTASPGEDGTPAVGCGDGLCGHGEDCDSCTADCGQCCAGGLCVFPGAQGYGVTTPAGRGGQVIRVTNLDDDGPGSLRHALDQSGPRIIIFDVSGEIRLSSSLDIENDFVTVAGQTAPSPGITLRGEKLDIDAGDVLVQHIRVRIGDETGGSPDGINIGSGAHDIVLDHISVSWAIDENLSVGQVANNDITISNSIISEALHDSTHSKGAHSKGLLLGTHSHNIALIGNLWAHNDDRQLGEVQGATTSLYVNNVSYNAGRSNAFTFHGGDSGPHISTVIGNVAIAGPDSPFDEIQPIPIDVKDAQSAFYFEDNLSFQVNNKSNSDIKSTPPTMVDPLTPMPASATEAAVLAFAGARPADRDAVDARIVNEVKTRTGSIIDSQDDVGGWPTLKENTVPLTLPPDPDGDADGDGYTNLEEWLHELAHDVGG
jgi:hypothetical protein